MNIPNVTPTPEREAIAVNFDTERYAILNRIRWEVLLGMGIPIAGQVIFEPGAGVGDQTQWLLDHGASRIIVNDGRPDNLAIIRERFSHEQGVCCLAGDLETSLWPEIPDHHADLVFLWGVYYHIKDSLEEFNVLKSLARVGESIVLEFLESDGDTIESYGYQNPSTSVSEFGIRPTMTTMLRGLKMHWEHVYLPRVQMDWHDPYAPNTPRRIVFASHEEVQNENLIKQ